MPEYLSPGVYVEEQPSTPPIVGVGTSTAGFGGKVDDSVSMLLKQGCTTYNFYYYLGEEELTWPHLSLSAKRRVFTSKKYNCPAQFQG
jgi:phage tail sheath protein FI